MQTAIVQSHLRFHGFVLSFRGCLCPNGWVSTSTGLVLCYYLNDRHVSPNTVLVTCMMAVFPSGMLLPV
jgi:hypothetical protein